MTFTRANLALIAASAIALAAATPAFAKSDTDARATAINACRTAVAAALQADPADVRLERIRTGARTVETRFEARKDGARVGLAECTFARAAATTTVAVIEPATQTASATATTAQ